MGYEIDSLPNRPLPFEALTKLTAVHSLCLVNHSAPNACPNIMWKGREGEYPDRNLHLSTPDSEFFDFSQKSFISRLARLAQSFCCNSHRENIHVHAYFAYLWVADYIIELGPSHKWDKEQLDWFGLRNVTDLLNGQRPPFLNKDQERCFLDTLERCADYLPEGERQKFINSMRNMMMQGIAVTTLDDIQLIKVNEILGRLEVSEDPVKTDDFLGKPQRDEERDSSTDVESEAGASELEDTLDVGEVALLPTEYLQEDRKKDFADWMRDMVPPGQAVKSLGDEQLVMVEELPEEVQHEEESEPRTSAGPEADEPNPQKTITVDEWTEFPTNDTAQSLEDGSRNILLEEIKVTRLDYERSTKSDERSVKTDARLVKDEKQSMALDEQLMKFGERLMKTEEQLMKFEEQLLKTEERSVKADELWRELQRIELSNSPSTVAPKTDGILDRLQPDEKREPSIHVETQTDESSEQLPSNEERDPSPAIEPKADNYEAQPSTDNEPEVDDFVAIVSEAGTSLTNKPKVEAPNTSGSRQEWSEADRPGVDGSEVDESEIDDPSAHDSEADDQEVDELDTDESDTDDHSSSPSLSTIHPTPSPALQHPIQNPRNPFNPPLYRYPWFRYGFGGSAV